MIYLFFPGITAYITMCHFGVIIATYFLLSHTHTYLYVLLFQNHLLYFYLR